MKESKFTKDEYIALRIGGISRKEIAKSKGYTLSHLEGYWLKKWGLKDPDQEEMAILDAGGVDPKLTGLIALNEQRREEVQTPVAEVLANAWPMGFDVELFERKDAEIAELKARLQRAIERMETMTKTVDNYLDANNVLKQECDDYKQAATELESKVVGYMDALGAAKLLVSDLEHDRAVLLDTIEKASIAEDSPVQKLAGRSLHTELDAPTEQIVDELAALISYIRSGKAERFYLDLQLNEVVAG